MQHTRTCLGSPATQESEDAVAGASMMEASCAAISHETPQIFMQLFKVALVQSGAGWFYTHSESSLRLRLKLCQEAAAQAPTAEAAIWNFGFNLG